MESKRSPTVSRLAAALALSIVPPAGAQGKSDWSRVRSLQPGMRTTVKLFEDEAPKGKRTIKGKLASVTPESITLATGGASSQTFARQAVRQVLAARPYFRRVGGPIGAGIGLLLVYGVAPRFLSSSYDFTAVGSVLFTAIAAVPGFLIGAHLSKMGTVYKAPPQDGAADDGR